MDDRQRGDPARGAPLERGATVRVFERLAAREAIGESALAAARAHIEAGVDEERDSREWLSRALLSFGSALCLAGVIFFFAFNWSALPGLARLGIVATGFVAALVGATIPDWREAASKTSLVAAMVLVGVFLAVFGQHYQTGADPWQLFALWSALILPLVVVARTQAGWILFGTTLVTFALLFVEQGLDLGPYREVVGDFYPNLVAMITGGIGAGMHLWRRHTHSEWLEHPWGRYVCAVFFFGALATPVAFYLELPRHALQLVALAAATAGLVSEYRHRRLGLGFVAVAGVAWLCICLSVVGQQIFDVIDNEVAAFFLMLVLTLVCSTALVAALRALADRTGDTGEAP